MMMHDFSGFAEQIGCEVTVGPTKIDDRTSFVGVDIDGERMIVLAVGPDEDDPLNGDAAVRYVQLEVLAVAQMLMAANGRKSALDDPA